ncbi:collagen alpha-1(XII) chain-like [Haliotis asinina]|uniref:collagen alpha-1(XII) chain-like n=1 Tax=Haliotis asinina TaxID=109174 RepID=UPI0035327179
MLGAFFILLLMSVSALGDVTNECSTSAQADIVFLLDTSGSVGPTNFAEEVSFVSDFVQGFSVGPSAMQFSVVLFSTNVANQFNLNRYNNRADLVKAIQSVRYLDGATNTASALTFVRENSFLASNGGRSGATQILIVITDGRSANMNSTASEASLLHQDGVKVISVGVGSGISMEELRAIASDNSLVFTAANFSALGIVKNEIQNKTCTEIRVDEPCGEAALPIVTARMLNAPIAGLCEWPWMVSVRLGPGNIPAHRCTGVLIGKRKVITTASCASRYTPHSVIAGENNLLLDNEALNADNFEVVVKINKTVIHPQHAGNEYDIAVLHLDEDVAFNRCVLPACLPGPRDSSCEDSTLETCAFAGWGFYSDVTVSLSRRLRETRGRYLNPTVCDAVYKQARGQSPPNNTVCLVPHDPSQAPCQGDEGGMVRCLVQDKWIFQSVINYPSCTDSFPSLGVDLRHPDILSFIKSN